MLWERRKARKTMEEIERMLDAAMTGSFSETNFDESQLSALERSLRTIFPPQKHLLKHSAGKRQNQNLDCGHFPPDENADCKPAVIQRAFDGGNSACIGEGKCGGAVQTIGKAAISDRFSRKASRLENGIISLSPQQAALQPLLESVVEQYTAKASEKGLSLQMQDTDAFAVFDFKWTAEALANIVDNAIKYTEHGTITISAVSYEMFARIDISDTGSGIPESEQAKIFARFYRSNSVAETRRGRHRLIPCPTDHIRRGRLYQGCFRSGKRK